jgi:L-galactonate 5-dehydrogenase
MKAVQISEPGVARLIEVPTPSPGVGEVLLRVHTVGYCGSDLSTYRGANPLVSYPRIPGHEIAANIEQLGDGVDQWSVGHAVLVFPYTECGKCAACRANRPNCCQHNQTMGVQREGAMSEFAVVPANKLLAAEGLSHRDLALVEPLTVGAHAVARGDVTDRDTVLVFGCGAIGLGVIAAAHDCGARVIATDIDDEKLAIARRCGAREAINSTTEDLVSRLSALTGDGPSVVIEAVGLPQTFRAAVDLVAFAGRVVYIGYAKSPVEYETKYFVMKELDIRGSRNALATDFERVIGMLQRGVIPTSEVITDEVHLDHACAALQQWSEQPSRVTKLHVRM